MPANRFDSIVTDPPYGLEFMGKGWDRGVPGILYWTEALRVAKPGAFLLAFGGTRTFHRLACAIEDSGWEMRDCISWVYGSGFPKSHDIGKAIDKAAGADRDIVGEKKYAGGHVQRSAAPRFNGNDYAGGSVYVEPPKRMETLPATEAAKQWQGWGTALKPAWEPIIVARKPFPGTVAANVLANGTGAMNIDACRIASEGGSPLIARRNSATRNDNAPGIPGEYTRTVNDRTSPERYMEHRSGELIGRWPANFIHDGSGEIESLFPNSKSGSGTRAQDGHGKRDGYRMNESEMRLYGDQGSASRFFYCAKTSKEDRGEGNDHPTVKPCDLMRYLCRLVTQPGGIVFDPFMGSGSTGKAAAMERFRFCGCEQDDHSFMIAKRRIHAAYGMDEFDFSASVLRAIERGNE